MESPPYIPKISFPRHLVTKAQKKELLKLKEHLKKLNITLSFLANRFKIEEVMALHAHGEIQGSKLRPLRKLKTRGKFTTLCFLEELNPEETLCDLGKSVNVMSTETGKRLGIEDMKLPLTPLNTHGLLNQVPFKSQWRLPPQSWRLLSPTDFFGYWHEPTPKTPFFLGGPFFKIVGAEIDFPNKRVIVGDWWLLCHMRVERKLWMK